MFKAISYQASEGIDPLKQLVSSSITNLKEHMQMVCYPEGFTRKEWDTRYREVDRLNSDLLNAIQKRSGVYAILTTDHRNKISLRYIGKTFSKYSRQRIRAHVIWRNKVTKSGKFTGSKFDEVQETVARGKSVYVSFVEINPATLRHYVEGVLLEYFSPEWNIQEVPELTGVHRTLCNWDDHWIESESKSTA